MNTSRLLLPALLLGFTRLLAAQTPTAEPLPGKGLAQHDFLYAGESPERKIFLLQKGQVTWTYDDPAGKGEISDAVRLSNGNILIAHQFAVKLIGPDKTVLWNYEAPAGTEIHTAMPIGLEHVLFVQNGAPALARVINIRSGATRLEFELPVKNPKSVHGQFRHARITPAGRLLVAHMDLGRVSEYDAAGKEVWSFPAPGVWGANPLANGNVLVTAKSGVTEVNAGGETVWAWTPADAPEFPLKSLQLAWRLPNGNTLINNWLNLWNASSLQGRDAVVQALEVAPDKKVVWVLRSWNSPDLGPSTTLQMLDEPGAPEAVSFGGIK